MALQKAERPQWNTFECLRRAKSIVDAELAAIEKLSNQLPVTLADAVQMLLDCTGSVIVTGIGKAGWIGQKISASLASTGTRSHFLHPSEAIHGDLGRIGDDDIVLMLSNSGNTPEITQLLGPLAKRKIPIIAISATTDNEVAQAATLVLNYGKANEACHLGLAPSTTTTLMLVLGDALCLVTAQERQFSSMNFATFHPGGTLGLKLSRVEEIMRPLQQCRIASEDQTVRQVFSTVTSMKRRSGVVLLTDQSGTLRGLFTDSDLARLLESQKDAALDQPIHQIMTAVPKTIVFGSKTQEAVNLLAKYNISELPVVDQHNRPIGVIDITDVLNLLPKH